jgi:hypothetical protein
MNVAVGLVLATLLLWIVVRAIRKARAARDETHRANALLVGRCNCEHALWTQDDVRGLYGQYPPEDLSD